MSVLIVSDKDLYKVANFICGPRTYWNTLQGNLKSIAIYYLGFQDVQPQHIAHRLRVENAMSFMERYGKMPQNLNLSPEPVKTVENLLDAREALARLFYNTSPSTGQLTHNLYHQVNEWLAEQAINLCRDKIPLFAA